MLSIQINKIPCFYKYSYKTSGSQSFRFSKRLNTVMATNNKRIFFALAVLLVLNGDYIRTCDLFQNKFIWFSFGFSYCPAVFQNQVAMGQQRCCGKFRLENCTTSCARASCLNKYLGPRPCIALCEQLCVCKGDLIYDECSQDCVHPDHCPPQEEVEQCAQLPESFTHCNECNTGNW